MRTLIKGGCIVNENRCFEGSVMIEDDEISQVLEVGEAPRSDYDECVDATGCFVFPGVIDTHVHFREPGFTHKADIESESRAAAYGGVTSFFDMPNTRPFTTNLDSLHEKMMLASEKSHVNYAFFYGATNDNYVDFSLLDKSEVPGIKLFMGSSTGNMLVDKYGSLIKIFSEAARVGLPVVAHCEDSDIIETNLKQMKSAYGEDPDVALHPLIRNEEACFSSSSLAVELAKTFGTRLHVAHVSTARELELFASRTSNSNLAPSYSRTPIPTITAEAALPHLFFTSKDYASLGTKIKCNPAIKREEDREALRKALSDGRITTVATDHAPHLLDEKQGGCVRAASGIPMIQFSLISMLGMSDEGILPMERVAELMCHAPARLFSVYKRGFIREGYKADLAIVSRQKPWMLTKKDIQSKCGWSPLEGKEFAWRVDKTYCNGRLIYDNGKFDDTCRGEKIVFRKER